MRIGVFDSGIGGEAIAAALQRQFPDADIMTVNDKAHLPYGTRPRDEIIKLTDAAIQPLLAKPCDVIVIACNSATTAAIKPLRDKYPQQFFVGIEPMIKAAATATKTKIVGVCATSATLHSERYKELKDRFGTDITYIEPNCDDWAELIEQNSISQKEIDQIVSGMLAENADVIVLGCTHYHWIKEEIIQATAGRAVVLEPSDAIGRRLKEILGL